MVRAHSAAFLLLFWGAVMCFAAHNSEEPSHELVLRDSLEDGDGVDMWEASGEPIMATMTEDWDNMMCLDTSGNALPCEAGDRKQEWVYKRLHGGTLQTATGNKCLTRKGSTITVEECNDSGSQKWKRLCGAWANGDGESGRVLEFGGKEGEDESKVRAAQWTGEPKQLWHFEEVVHHSACSKKKHKVMQFDGTPGSTVALRAFLSMPSKVITVGVWVKGNKGTPFSYSSKHHVKAFTVTNLKSLQVHVKDMTVDTGVDFTNEKKWSHLAVSWNSAAGDLKVYKNGKQVFSKSGVQQGKSITQGGCLWLGQSQQKYCKQHDAAESFNGVLTDFQIVRQELGQQGVEKMMTHPVDNAILDGVNKDKQDIKTPRNLRVAFLARQFNGEEMSKPEPEVCQMDIYKKKDTPKLPQVGGTMYQFSGTGDVHYRNFNRSPNSCHFDDQSVGEWVLSMVKPEFFQAAPLMIQYRTSPSWANNCPWCQNGAVSYIDGCALRYGDEQVSAGFGGYHYPRVAGMDGAGPGQYRRYAAFNGQAFHGHRNGKNIEAWTDGNYLKVKVKSVEVLLNCRRQAIYLTMSNSFKGKVDGIAGTGMGKDHDWTMGPNTQVYKGCKPGEQMPGLKGQCPRHFVYGNREHPLNGNRADKPLVKWFRTWQVDGEQIPSVFYYSGSTHAGSFNRNAGEAVKPVKNVNDRPTGKRKAAMDECKLLRATPEAREKCVFDFMIRGARAIKESQKDRMAQRAAKVRTFTVRSVRDITSFVNNAEWAGKPLWECGDDFVGMQKMLAKEHEDLWATRKSSKRQKDAEESAACPAGFQVVAEQTDAHTQESKKCADGLMALTVTDVEKAKAAEEKKEEKQKEEEKEAAIEKAQAKGKKVDDDKEEEKEPYWSNGPQPTTTQVYDNMCLGIGCARAPKKPLAGPCKDARFPYKSTCHDHICYSKKEYASCGPNEGCKSWCCINDSCKAGCAINKCKPTVEESREAEFLSSSGTSIFSSGRPVNRLHNPSGAGKENTLVARDAVELDAVELLDLGESADEADEHTCKDSNKDKFLSCDQIKADCSEGMVQAMCASTCGTPWAGNSACQKKALAEKKYQCKPASVCKLPDQDPQLPDGYKWLVQPKTRVVKSLTEAPCKTWTSLGVAVCATGKKVETSYKVGKKKKKMSVQCGCEGGIKLVSHGSSSMDAGCTGGAQQSRANQTKTFVTTFEEYQAQAAAWGSACSKINENELGDSNVKGKLENERYQSTLSKLQPISAAAKKRNFYTAPWRFRKMHTSHLIKKQSKDEKCDATFSMAMWVCDAAPMRDVVLYIPDQGYNTFTVGCGCQQLRVQTKFAGKITAMTNRQEQVQQGCSEDFTDWNTQFQAEHYADYRQRAQNIADEVERQCMKSTLELNNLASQELRQRKDTQLILEENSAHLGKLSGVLHKMQIKSKEYAEELSTCKKKTFVQAGVPEYERKTKELARTVDRNKAKKLQKDLADLKAKLDAHQASVAGQRTQ